ncbi:acyltransferase [Gimesia sp.]|uniref:acyltransferase family protein n=1 Tax=Gimesia sp. TaxID=2024833 RepID=UPI000C35542B|nr:acyltransferase [Gimesia sp.]MAX35631.1 acyltransferase [Gimesia sp.]|tara:strand:- start:682 stop:1800 length:1119 start_codon:yes stop_codon:yes gene_type:complete
MKSSCGQYYIGLDHLRALAAFMVFSWHMFYEMFHSYQDPSFFPLSLFNEGHTGVALFMTLSGYLFAKLLAGKKIKYTAFFWNRFIRLAPLMVFVLSIVGIQKYWSGESLYPYFIQIRDGMIEPVLPNGGWSITVEWHFYLMLPLLLFLMRKSKYALAITVGVAFLLRIFLQKEYGDLQWFSYWTIFGRIDQFLLGMIAYQCRAFITGRHYLVAGSILAFSIFYWYFDKAAGFWFNPSYPSNRFVWVYLSTVEGFVYALLIAWYDSSFSHSTGKVSQFIAKIGTYSYSIYLLHFFFYQKMVALMATYIMPASNLYMAFCYSVLGFLMMVPIGFLSFRFIESPFLKLRTKYLITAQAPVVLEKDSEIRTESMAA